MNLREKYGEWGLILGATEGVGKAFCEKIAAGGMNAVSYTHLTLPTNREV